MGYLINDLAITIAERDTFCIPIAIRQHVPNANETYVFTVRRMLPATAKSGVRVGETLFKKTISYSSLTMIKDENNNIVGCQFMIQATKAETANIPDGKCFYDLAIVNSTTQWEYQLIPPSPFIVGEVLRYE